MILDGLAAFKLLAEFNLNGIRSVLKAHYYFWISLPALIKKRKLVRQGMSSKQSLTGILHKSLVFQFYFRKRKRFSEL